MKNLIEIGKILKTHGFKGNIRIAIDSFYMADFEDNIDVIFINTLPYFVNYKDINTDEQAIIALDDIDTKEKAQKLLQQTIFVKATDLTEIIDADNFTDLLNFDIEIKNIGIIGIIECFEEFPQQLLIKTTYKNKAILIPYNDAFIIKIDEKLKKILLDLPEGFLDIF